MTRIITLASCVILVLSCCADLPTPRPESEPLYSGPRPAAQTGTMERPRSIILMIGDGYGYNQLKASAYYGEGHYPPDQAARFDMALAVSTWPLNGSYDPELAWSDFSYPPRSPTDSAAAATALATGNKTENGMISVLPDGTPLETLLERAESRDMLTGIVTSVPVSHATPACFAAHNASRGAYSAIADAMILQSGLDVLLGCGNPDYDDNGSLRASPDYSYLSQTTWESLLAGIAANDRDADGTPDPWKLVTEAEGIRALASANSFEHALAMPRVGATLQQRRNGDAKSEAYAVLPTPNVPNLAEMTTAALNLLSKGSNGFVLVVEGGAIDWANHANQSGRMIEEARDFDLAVAAALQWIDSSPNGGEILIVATADHESGYLLGPESGPGAFNAIIFRGIRVMPGMAWYGIGHTNSLVPFFAKGRNALYFANDIAGFDSRRGWYVDNAAIGQRLLDMLNLKLYRRIMADDHAEIAGIEKASER